LYSSLRGSFHPLPWLFQKERNVFSEEQDDQSQSLLKLFVAQNPPRPLMGPEKLADFLNFAADIEA
jgi:hypothetical protein